MLRDLTADRWDLEDALTDAISFQEPRDAAEEVIRSVLPDPKYRAEILEAMGRASPFVACPYCDASALGPNALTKHIERRHPSAVDDGPPLERG